MLYKTIQSYVKKSISQASLLCKGINEKACFGTITECFGRFQKTNNLYQKENED